MFVKHCLMLLLPVLLTLLLPAAQDEGLTLIEVTPDLSETLDFPPEAIRLTFDQPLREASSAQLLLAGGDGTMLAEAEGVAQDALVLPVPPDLTDGTYVILYEAISQSDDQTSGELTFRVQRQTPSLRVLQPSDGAIVAPGRVTVDVESRGVREAQVRVLLAGEVLAEGLPPIMTPPLAPGIYTLDVMLMTGNDPLPATTQQVTVVLTDPPTPTPAEVPTTVIQPTTGAEAIASVIAVVVLLVVGVLLGRRYR